MKGYKICMYDLSIFESDLSQFNIFLSTEQKEQFLTYYEMLVDKNKVMNLTAITDFDEVMKKHFVDSLSMIKAVDLSKELRIVDIGTGAGFPGIPLKIAFPNLKITLIDSLNKRILFLEEVIERLNLYDIDALHGRAEDYAKQDQMREKFDICVSRAVANLSTLSEYCLPFVRLNGSFISYKSEKIGEELNNACNAIEILGGRLKKQVDFYLPESDLYRNIVVIEKMKQTPKKYPRKAGTASKNPL